MRHSLGLIGSAPRKPPIFLKFRSSEGLIISTVALAIFTDIFLYGVRELVSKVNKLGNYPDIAVCAGSKGWR
jgi:hypothetical protein